MASYWDMLPEHLQRHIIELAEREQRYDQQLADHIAAEEAEEEADEQNEAAHLAEVEDMMRDARGY